MKLTDEQIIDYGRSFPALLELLTRESARVAFVQCQRALLSASNPAVQPDDVRALSEGYRRGIKDAFHLVNMANANRQGRTADETCSYIVRTLAEQVNSGEIPAAPAQSTAPVVLSREAFDHLFEKACASAQSEPAADVPEGCTVADAKMLHEANHALAAENDMLRMRLRPFAQMASSALESEKIAGKQS